MKPKFKLRLVFAVPCSGGVKLPRVLHFTLRLADSLTTRLMPSRCRGCGRRGKVPYLASVQGLQRCDTADRRYSQVRSVRNLLVRVISPSPPQMGREKAGAAHVTPIRDSQGVEWEDSHSTVAAYGNTPETRFTTRTLPYPTSAYSTLHPSRPSRSGRTVTAQPSLRQRQLAGEAGQVDALGGC